MRVFDKVYLFNNTTGEAKWTLPTLTSQFVVEVRGSSSMSLKIYGGCSKNEDDEPETLLACIDSSDFSTKTEITQAGIYNYAVDGIYTIKAVLSGDNVTVLGKAGG